MSYTGQMSNSITTKEDQILKSNLIKDWRNGIQHRIPIDATFQLFKYINISPPRPHVRPAREPLVGPRGTA